MISQGYHATLDTLCLISYRSSRTPAPHAPATFCFAPTRTVIMPASERLLKDRDSGTGAWRVERDRRAGAADWEAWEFVLHPSKVEPGQGVTIRCTWPKCASGVTRQVQVACSLCTHVLKASPLPLLTHCDKHHTGESNAVFSPTTTTTSKPLVRTASACPSHPTTPYYARTAPTTTGPGRPVALEQGQAVAGARPNERWANMHMPEHPTRTCRLPC